MHTVIVDETFDLAGVVIPAGVLHLIDDVNVPFVLKHGKNTRTESWKLPQKKRFDVNQDWNERKILLMRAGGIGDLLFLTPSLARLKTLWSRCRLVIACVDEYRDLFEGNPCVDEIISHPVALSEVESADVVVNFEGFIECDPRARQLHAVDLAAAVLGIELVETQVQFFLNDKELQWARKAFPRGKGSQRVAIQVHSSAPCRTYPMQLMQKVIYRLRDSGWEVLLFGQPGFFRMRRKMCGVVSLLDRQPPLTFRQSCAVLTTCDVVLAPDSALIHVAGALELPAVGIYGPFPWQLRTAYAPKTRSLNGIGDCVPCFHHQRADLGAFPEGKPCSNIGVCVAMGRISPARIVREVERVAKVR